MIPAGEMVVAVLGGDAIACQLQGQTKLTMLGLLLRICEAPQRTIWGQG